MTKEDLENRFTYYASKPGQLGRRLFIHGKAEELAEAILRDTPSSREQSLAVTAIEEAVMWANAAISRNEKE